MTINPFHLSLLIALLSPLLVVVLLSVSFFLRGTPQRNEKVAYRLVRFAYLLNFGSALSAFLIYVFSSLKSASLSLAKFSLGPRFSINLSLFYDHFSLIFLLTSAITFLAITIFSRRYLHRDPGYRRFFITISLFAFGLNLIILAGNFDLVFAGWEIVGLSSYLLIAYFWHRPKAVMAASRAYYIYRVCDLGLLASLLITHFFWHDISVFGDFLSQGDSVLEHVSLGWRWLLSICILLPVLAKSAQFPFCFWLPKAMEGPTHSSAIFYGALSIHVGVYLLIRSMPIWHATEGFSLLLGSLGLITAISASIFALVQSNIKGQIGYASIAQVGLMLLELSLGFPKVAFAHMIGHAFLRTFQLLVSSSIVTIHLHQQNVIKTFGQLKRFSLPNFFPARLWPTIYIFALNEGFFEACLKKIFVMPVLSLAKNINDFLNKTFKSSAFLIGALILSALLPVFLKLPLLQAPSFDRTSVLGSFVLAEKLFSLSIALILALASLGEKKHAMRGLAFAVSANSLAFLSIAHSRPSLIYLIGLLTSSIVAIDALRHIKKHRRIDNLAQFHGLYQQFPLAGTILLLGILGVLSFPFASTFFGEDFLLEESLSLGFPYLLIFQIIFIIGGIALIRLYSLIMLGKRNNVMKNFDLDFSSRAALLRTSLYFLGNIAAFFLAIY